MKSKQVSKIVIDVVMTVVMFILMACWLTGETLHEWLGVGLIVLFIIHNILNFGWYRNLLKGKYSLLRILYLAVNSLLLVSMFGVMISGIMLSRVVFDFLHISSGMLFARKLHMLCSYWGFILISLHIGMHWGMVIGTARKLTRTTTVRPAHTAALRVSAVLIAVYGIYAFLYREIPQKLVLYLLYDFWDYDKPAVLFFLDYLAVIGLFIFAIYYPLKLLRRRTSEKKQSDTGHVKTIFSWQE